MIITSSFYTFIVGAHAFGWALVARQARNERIVDLCQFVRAFIFAPFALAGSTLLLFMVGALVWGVLLPNIIKISEIFAIMIGACVILGVLGYFVITPAVKKAKGIAKPFSEKICVVLYRSKK